MHKIYIYIYAHTHFYVMSKCVEKCGWMYIYMYVYIFHYVRLLSVSTVKLARLSERSDSAIALMTLSESDAREHWDYYSCSWGGTIKEKLC